MSTLTDTVQARPDLPFVLAEDRQVTRGQLAALIESLRRDIVARRLGAVVTHTADAAQIVAALAASEAARVPIVLAHATLPEAVVADVCRSVGASALLDASLQWIPISGAEAVAPGEFTVTLMTSGTTGVPKLARHHLASLLGRIPQPGGPANHQAPRWLLTYQPTTFAGLQVILTALCTHGAVVQTLGRTPADFVAVATRFQATHASGTPTFWRSWLLAAPPGSLALQQITLGGEVVDQATLDRLAQRFPTARLTHIYASTEAGSLFAVHDGRSGFPRTWLDSRGSGVGLRVRGGVLEVESPRRMLAYVGASAHVTEDGWLVTGDLVDVETDRVYFQGRSDDVLNIGGAKVHPQEVEQFLLSCPGVAEARVRGVRTPLAGWLLAADVVLAPGDDAEARRLDLMRRCQEQLPSHKAPRIIRIVAEVPMSASGKKA